MGDGTPLHHSPRAMNIEFEGRVVTVLNRNGVLTPSSIILDIEDIPKVERAVFNGNVLETDLFSCELRNKVDLQLHSYDSLDVSFSAETLGKYLVEKERSIINAVLHIKTGWNKSGGNDLERVVLDGEINAIKSSKTFLDLAKNLLGVGFGLTPSGDDFILGMVAVLYGCRIKIDGMRNVILNYKNSFSRTMLLDGLDGYFPSPLLLLMNSLIDKEQSDSELEFLLDTGHTSGYDTLAGMYYATNMLL